MASKNWVPDEPTGRPAPAAPPAIDAENGRMKASGTLSRAAAAAHIIVAVIGSGVPSMAWAMAQLGWVPGVVVLLLWALFTYWASMVLLASQHSVDESSGAMRRNNSYTQAVQRYTRRHLSTSLCGLLQNFTFLSVLCSSTEASVRSIRFVWKNGGIGRRIPAHAIFCAMQLVLSQVISGLDKMRWVSMVAVAMSISTTLMCTGLGLARVAANKAWGGGVIGVVAGLKPQDKAWRSLLVLGDVAFAYAPLCHLLLEVAASTLPVTTKKEMRHATKCGTVFVTISYLLCSFMVYAAFGDATPDNLVAGFVDAPSSVVRAANVTELIYLICAYQLYCQALFAAFERWARRRLPEAFMDSRCGGLFRRVSRVAFVAAVTAASLFVPHLDEFVRVVSALNYWPLTVYHPIQMYKVQKKVPRWSEHWVRLEMLNVFGFVFAAATLVASVAKLISTFKG